MFSIKVNELKESKRKQRTYNINFNAHRVPRSNIRRPYTSTFLAIGSRRRRPSMTRENKSIHSTHIPLAKHIDSIVCSVRREQKAKQRKAKQLLIA